MAASFNEWVAENRSVIAGGIPAIRNGAAEMRYRPDATGCQTALLSGKGGLRLPAGKAFRVIL